MKVIVTTENTELWHNLASSFDDKNIKFVESYSDLENNLESSLVFCHQPIIDFERLADDLKNAKIESAIIFYQQSEFVLAEAISQGDSLDNVANNWLQQSRALLNVQKQNRRKLKLVNLNQALLNSTTFATQMEEQGISFVNSIDYQVNSDFNLLLATQHVRQEQGLTRSNDILTASSLPVSETNTVFIDNASVLDKRNAEIQSIADLKNKLDSLNIQVEEKENASVVANKELKRERAVVAALKEELELQNTSMVKQVEDVKLENELLELQLASLQEELEQIYSNFESEKQQHKQTELKLTTQINDSLTNLETVKSEVELLELQLSQVQEELEEYYLANQSKDKLIDELKIEMKVAENKYTEAISTLQNAQSEYDVLKKKHTDAEKQLSNSTNLVRTLNSKIANLNASASSKDKAHTKDKQQIKLKQMELDKQSSLIAKAKNEIDVLNHNLNQAKAELAQIKSSTLWKSAEPMRRLVKTVGKVDKKKAKLQQNIGLLLTSEYFDATWYLETYPDVAASGINPAEHYLKFGAKEGRFPSPQFDGNWYLKRYPDIADADINPLIHFIKFGISEGRRASPKMLINQNKT